MRTLTWLLPLLLLAAGGPALAQKTGLAALIPDPRPGDRGAIDPKDYSYEEWQTLIKKVGWARVSKTQTECDRLTANENDPGLTAPPVEFKDLDARAALKACQADLAKDPKNGRLMNNLGRAYNKAKDYLQSYQWTERAVRAGHAYAHHAMALHYLYGESVDKSRPEELRWLKKGRERGVPVSATRLAKLAMEGYGRPDYDAARVRELLREAGQGRSNSWAWGDYYFYQAIRDYYGEHPGISSNYEKGKLPDGDDVSIRFGPARITEFGNLLRSARAHYEDAELTGKNQVRRNRIAAIDRVLKGLENRYALR